MKITIYGQISAYLCGSVAMEESPTHKSGGGKVKLVREKAVMEGLIRKFGGGGVMEEEEGKTDSNIQRIIAGKKQISFHH